MQLLAKAPLQEREFILKTELERLLRSTLGISTTTAISDTQGFFEMGMDSLMAVELKNRIQMAVGDEFILPATWSFENPNINCLNALKARLKNDYFPDY